MRVGLNIGERLITISVLPKEGSFVTLRVIRKVIEKIGLTSDEIKKFGVEEKDGNVHWNLDGNIPIPFDFEEVELDLIKKELRKRDAESRLSIELFTVYEKFMIQV